MDLDHSKTSPSCSAIRKEVKVLWSSSKRSPQPGDTVRIPPVFYPFDLLFQSNNEHDDDAEVESTISGKDDQSPERRSGNEEEYGTANSKKRRRLDFTSVEATPSTATTTEKSIGQVTTSQSSGKSKRISTLLASGRKTPIREILNEFGGLESSIVEQKPSPTSVGVSSGGIFGSPPAKAQIPGLIGTGPKLSLWALTGGAPNFCTGSITPVFHAASSSTTAERSGGDKGGSGRSSSARIQVLRQELKLLDELKRESTESRHFEEKLAEFLKEQS